MCVQCQPSAGCRETSVDGAEAWDMEAFLVIGSSFLVIRQSVDDSRCLATRGRYNVAMSVTRRQKIEAMLAEEPQDQFLRYSLALELEKEGDNKQSLEWFSGLTRDA